MKNRGFIICAAVAVFCMFGAGCSTVAANGGVTQTLPPSADPVSVEVLSASRGTISQMKEYTGTLKPQDEIAVGLKLAGKVSRVNVSLGDTVREGDVLMELDEADVQLQIDSAKAAYDVAKAGKNSSAKTAGDLNSTKKELQDAKKKCQESITTIRDTIRAQYKEGLMAKDMYTEFMAALKSSSSATVWLSKLQGQYQAGYISLAQYNEFSSYVQPVITLSGINEQLAAIEQAKQQLPDNNLLNAQIEQANTGVKAAEAQLENTKVLSPASGIIGLANVSVGEIASQAVPPFVIINIDNIYFEFQAIDQDVVLLKEGMGVLVYVDVLPGQNFNGSVETISPMPDAYTGAYTVRVKLNNSGHQLKAGLFARCSITANERGNVITLPMDCVMNNKGEHYVFIEEYGAAVKKTVELGLSDGVMTEITSGLNEGDKVICSGQDFLADGEFVKAIIK